MQGHIEQKTINALAIAVILGFIVIIATSLLISNQSGNLFGPTVLAEDDNGSIFVNIGTTLYQLDSYGHILDSASQPDLGLPQGKFTDVLPLSNGSTLVALARPGRIYSCSFSQRQCSDFLPPDTRITQTLKMTWHKTRQELFVIDADAGRILVFDASGELLKSSEGGAGGLFLPNTPLVSQSGELVIADTNHHRLVAIDAVSLDAELWEAPVKSELAMPGRTWPTDIAQASNGEFWAINDGNLLRYGDVIIFDKERKPAVRLELDAKWDPIKLIARSSDVLLASFGNYDLVSVSLDGSYIQPFGSDNFRLALYKAFKQQKSYDVWWDLWVWVLICPFVLLLIYVVYLDKQHKARVLVAENARTEHEKIELDLDHLEQDHLDLDHEGAYWLSHNNKFLKNIKLFKWLLPAMLLLSLFTLVPLMGKLDLQFFMLFGFVYLGMLLPMTAFAFIAFRGLTASRIGTDGNGNILLQAGDRKISSSPAKVYFNQRFVSAEDVFVVTHTNQPVFDALEFKNHIEPLLTRAHKLDAVQSFFHQVKIRPGFVRNTVLISLYFMLVLVALYYFD